MEVTKLKFDESMHIKDAIAKYGVSGVEFLTTPETYPMVNGAILSEDPKRVVKRNGKYKDLMKSIYENIQELYKTDQEGIWMDLGMGDYIFLPRGIGEEEKTDILARYISNLHYVDKKSDDNVLTGIRKRIARIATKYNLDLSVIDRFMLRQNSQVHSSYNRSLNAIRVVPEYFIRLGMIRIGDEFVDEFEKTLLHEYAHAIWYRLLDGKKRVRYKKLIPRFYTEEETKDSPEHYMRGRTNTLDGKVVYGDMYTLLEDEFVSDYARYSPKEDFSESFCYYKIDPSTLSENRFNFMKKITVGDVIEKTGVKIEANGVPISISRYVPVDFQTNEHRRQLAVEFESNLKSSISRIKKDISDIDNIVIYGEYASPEDTPVDLRAVVVMKSLTNRVEALFNSTKVLFVPSQEEADKLIYEFKSIGEQKDTNVKKRKAKKTKHSWYKPEEVEAYFKTEEGAIIPSPKGEGHRLPEGYLEPKLSAGNFEIEKPIETIYSLQHHFTEKAPTHYDLRIKVGEKAYSWALPKGLPTSKNRVRLAVLQPPHKVDYMKFSGKIKTTYGRGTVNLSDYRGVDIRDWSKKRKEFVIYSGPNKGRYVLKPSKMSKVKYILVKAKNLRDPIKEQYDPALARLSPKAEQFKDPNFVLQPKMDGARYLLYLGDKENRLLSRNMGIKKIHRAKGEYHVERTDNVPHIRDTSFSSPDTVLDGEIFRVDSDTTNSIMNSNPIRARRLQSKHGPMIYYAFDLLKYKGEDIRKLPYSTRLRYLREVVRNANGPGKKFIEVAPTFVNRKSEIFNELLRQGWEGVVLKDKRGQYTDRFMTKFKKIKEGDFGVIGHEPGKGKYEGMVGSLLIARNVGGKPIPVGKVGAGRITIAQRKALSGHVDTLVRNKGVVQVRYMERTSKGRLRAPVLMRVREDKTWKDLDEKGKGKEYASS